MTDQEFKAMEFKSAVNQAAIALRSRASSLADYAAKLDQRVEELEAYDPAQERLAKRSDLVNWAINDIENLLRNLNFAELARVYANLKGVESDAAQEAREALANA